MPDRLVPAPNVARVPVVEEHVERAPHSSTIMGKDTGGEPQEDGGRQGQGVSGNEELSRDLVSLMMEDKGFAAEFFDLLARKKFHNTRFVRSPELLTPYITLLCDHPQIITSSKLPELDIATIDNLKAICDRQWMEFPDARGDPYVPRDPPFRLRSLHQVARSIGGEPGWPEETRAA